MPDDQVAVLSRPGRFLRWAALAVLGFAVAAAVLAWLGYRGQVDRIVAEAGLRARGAAADVDRSVQARWVTLSALADAPAVRSGDIAAMRAYFESIDAEALGLDAGLAWVDRNGLARVRTGYDGPPIDFSQRPHIRAALDTGKPTVSAGLVGNVAQAPIIAFNVPVFDASGAVAGLLGSGIRLDRLSQGADDLRNAGGTSVVVIDQLGQLVVGRQPVTTLSPVAQGFRVADMRASGQGAYASTTGPLGETDQLIGYAMAPSAGWLVLVQTSAADAFGPATSALLLQLLIIFVSATLAIALFLWSAGRLGTAVDAQRTTLIQLQAAVGTLERRQALSDAFIGVMSHELRTPVTTIYGAAKLLARSPRRPELESLVKDIDEEADRLQRITEDLLVLARAEHGLVEVRPEPVLVQRLIPSVVDEVARRFPRAPIRAELDPDLPPVAGDQGAIRQLLDNLLANAGKYGAGSPILVRTERRDALLEISVEDRGPGLPAEDLERIFEIFYRSPGTAKQASGTGIGLFVVRQLVDAMGGDVRAEPVEPHGLRFVVTLPVYPEAEATLAGADPQRERPVPAAAGSSTV